MQALRERELVCFEVDRAAVDMDGTRAVYAAAREAFAKLRRAPFRSLWEFDYESIVRTGIFDFERPGQRKFRYTFIIESVYDPDAARRFRESNCRRWAAYQPS
jgi:hypothetical protein